LPIRQVCTKFQTNPLFPQYRVLSVVSSEVFKQFLSSLKGETIEVTKKNFKEFSALCDEFDFELKSPSYRLAQVETTIEELKSDIERIPSILTQLSVSMAKLGSDVSMLKEWSFVHESQILLDFPNIFAEFRGKYFSLLWRGMQLFRSGGSLTPCFPVITPLFHGIIRIMPR
jgi:hypothetical protein